MPSGLEPGPQQSAPDVTALYAAARKHHRERNLAAARALYEQVRALAPEHPGNLYHLAILALETARPRIAIDLLARVIAQRDAPDAHYHLALALQMERRLAEAETHYRQAVALKPDYVEAQMNLGNVLAERGSREEAAACYARVLALAPRAAAAHYNLANMLAALGRLDEAEAHFRAAIAGEPGFAEAWSNLGNLLRDTGKPREAEAAYRRALTLKPDHAEAHNNLGLALARRGDAAAAVACFRDALRLAPDDLDATHHLARELFAQGQAAEAVALLTRALDRNGNAETRSLFALCLRGLSVAELEGVRDYVLRALAEGWAHNGELEQPGIALVKHARAMAACIALANAAWLAGTTADLAQLLA